MVADGTCYEMTPDLTVLTPGWQRARELGVEPPPSSWSRSPRRPPAASTGRELAGYRLGGAGMYLLVDLPATFEAHVFVTVRS